MNAFDILMQQWHEEAIWAFQHPESPTACKDALRGFEPWLRRQMPEVLY
jgi:hypothetical protein